MRILLLCCVLLTQYDEGCEAVETEKDVNKGNIDTAGIKSGSGMSGFIVGQTIPPVTTTTTTPDPSSLLGDDPGFPACADIVFAIDTSCSVDKGNVSAAQVVAEWLVLTFRPPFVQYGGFTYNNITVDSFSYTTDNDAAAVALAGLNTASATCKTRTNRAITYSVDNYFNSVLDDPDSIDILIIFGDGNEAPFNENEAALLNAEAFKESGGIIIWVVLISKKEEEVRLRGIREQIEPMASVDERDGGVKLIFQYDDPDIVYKIAEYIASVATCPRS